MEEEVVVKQQYCSAVRQQVQLRRNARLSGKRFSVDGRVPRQEDRMRVGPGMQHGRSCALRVGRRGQHRSVFERLMRQPASWKTRPIQPSRAKHTRRAACERPHRTPRPVGTLNADALSARISRSLRRRAKRHAVRLRRQAGRTKLNRQNPFIR